MEERRGSQGADTVDAVSALLGAVLRDGVRVPPVGGLGLGPLVRALTMLEGSGQASRVLNPLRRRLLQGRAAPRPRCPPAHPPAMRQGRWLSVLVRDEDLDHAFAQEDRLTSQQKIGNGPNAVDVATGVEVGLPGCLFRGHVQRRADDDSFPA